MPITDTGQRSDQLLGDALPLYESLQVHIRRSTHFVTKALIELADVGPACLGGKRHRVAILGPGDLLYPLHKQAADTPRSVTSTTSDWMTISNPFSIDGRSKK